jgi:hypothetical protein
VPVDEDAAADGSVTEALEPEDGTTLAGVAEPHAAVRRTKATIEATPRRVLSIGRSP